MKNMKLSKREQKAEAVPQPTREEYPWGLKITLQKEELQKLGFDHIPKIGEKFEIQAKAVVDNVSASASKTGDYASIGLQITDMDLDSGDAQEKTAKTAKNLFGRMK